MLWAKWTVLEDAKRIGRNEGRAEVVCSMYRNGMKISEISKYTNISIAHLRRIVASQKA